MMWFAALPPGHAISIIKSKLNDSNRHTFFIVLRYEISNTGLDLDHYLKEVFRQIKDDEKNEPLESYSVRRLSFGERKAYYGILRSRINDTAYLAHTMYTSINGMVYDFTLKSQIQDSAACSEIFQDILFNYQANGKYVFVSANKIDKIEDVDPLKL